MTETHEGGCLCGAVRYRATGTPQRAAACACTSCQHRTGSAFGISVYFNETDVEILQGALRRYRFASDAGRWLETEFCEVCGTTVTWTLELRPGMRGIAGGTFDKPTFWYDVEAFIFVRSKPDWLSLPEDLDTHATAPYHRSVADVSR